MISIVVLCKERLPIKILDSDWGREWILQFYIYFVYYTIFGYYKSDLKVSFTPDSYIIISKQWKKNDFYLLFEKHKFSKFSLVFIRVVVKVKFGDLMITKFKYVLYRKICFWW